MSEISYPVEHSSGSVWTASGELLCDCPGGGDDDRRIAAALNATRGVTVEQLEAVIAMPVATDSCGFRSVTPGEHGDEIVILNNSGDAAEGE